MDEISDSILSLQSLHPFPHPPVSPAEDAWSEASTPEGSESAPERGATATGMASRGELGEVGKKPYGLYIYIYSCRAAW